MLTGGRTADTLLEGVSVLSERPDIFGEADNPGHLSGLSGCPTCSWKHELQTKRRRSLNISEPIAPTSSVRD
jgi:hypothetical protein